MSTEVIKTEILINSQFLLDSVKGCNWESDPVAQSFIDHVSYRDGKVTVRFLDEESEKITRSLTTADLARGLSKAIESGARHCGSYINLDYDEWDACVGTAILQFALFGEEIYG